ncbi:50S ribosomal protein L29 [Candidatus Woesearchaeota archaeon]|nr:50S ribosomal protein L29 [Candidatus Woesearchaeota archaeon]
MAIISRSDFKNMNVEQLNEKMSDLKKELMKINTQISTGTIPENPGRVKEVKKTIARIITVISIKKQQKTDEKKTAKPVEKTKEATKKQ